MHTPIFQEIDELHNATITSQKTVLPDFHIYRNEDANVTCVTNMEAHRCNFYQVSIDRKSNYFLWNNSQKIHTADNTIYFAGAGKLISWKATNKTGTWKGYNIIFKHDFLPAGTNNYNFRKEFPFLNFDNKAFVNIPSEDDLIFELCERMLYEQYNDASDINIIGHYLYALLYTIKRMYVQQNNTPLNQKISRETELANQFEELVNEYYLDFKSIKVYADKLFVSPKYLSQVSKNIYGKTAKEMILVRKGEEAKSLLMQTNFTISQIAARLEFNDTSNFIKFFKRIAGKGPSQFREGK